MLFSKINIKKELIRHRIQSDILNEVNKLLSSESSKDNDILSRLKRNDTRKPLEISIEDSQNIFSIGDIKDICVKFRLRFLDAVHFRAEYPYAAIAEIKAFEKKYDVSIQSFRIIAPSEAFELENINKDPLLFAQLNNNQYYFLHQWGHDLKWYRRLFAWPVKNFKSLLITLLFIASLFSFSLPDSVMNVFSFQSSMYLRIWLSIHTFIALTGFALWFGLAFDKSLSEMNWSSKYYNY